MAWLQGFHSPAPGDCSDLATASERALGLASESIQASLNLYGKRFPGEACPPLGTEAALHQGV